MTTYQEPPLQSRRAARQVERESAYGQRPETPEPLTYATQNRPALPQYDGAEFRNRDEADADPQDDAASSADAHGDPSTQLLPRQDVPSYRPRDFSPEGGRRSTRAAGAPVVDDGRIDYRTQNRAAVPVPIAPVTVAPVTPEPAPAEEQAPSHEYTLTRRELRALRESQGLSATPTDAAPVADVAEAAPVTEAAPESAAPESAAPEISPFEALFLPPSAAPLEPQPLVDPTALVEPPEAEEPSVPAEPIASPALIEPAPVIVPPALIEPAPVVEPAPLVEPQEATSLVAAEAASDPVSPITPPPGHWTTQSELDDATQVNESTISRSVGSGSGVITTSALVLPTIPSADYTHLGTGEVLVTGSIDLPHSLATSGAHPAQLDEHHLDHELDPGDQQVVSTDSQPVRAIKAISTHTSTRNVIVTKKSGSNKALTALIISAAGMAAVVVTLLVVGLASGVL